MFSTASRAFGTILAWLFGLGFIALAVYLFFDYSGLDIANAKTAEGTIIRLHETTKKNNKIFAEDYHSINPVVDFTTEDGKKVEFYEIWAEEDENMPYMVGQKVTVIYDSIMPEEARIKPANSLSAVHYFIAGIGLFIMIIPWLAKVARS
jgi:hypothetical protein